MTDVLLTDDLKPKLIEVNLAPSLAVSGPTDHIVKQPLVSDLLDLVFGPDEDPTKRIEPQSKILDDEEALHSVGMHLSILKPVNDASRVDHSGVLLLLY